MIVSALLNLVFMIINAILSLLGLIPGFPADFLSSALNYIDTVLTGGAGLFFFLIRPATFGIAIDIVFFIWIAEPLYYFIMWVLRKVPFINIE